MDSANLSSCKENYQENGITKISDSDEILNIKSDSITVDMEPFSDLTNKDLILTSRINLLRSLSRKGSQIGTEKKMNSNCQMNDGDQDAIPKASLIVGTMPEKLMFVNQSTDNTNSPQVHHQITIMAGGTTTTTTTTKPAGTPTKKSIFAKKSSSLKQLSNINPRRIIFFFATLSSMGSMLLIYLTLSTAKYNEDDNSHATILTQHP